MLYIKSSSSSSSLKVIPISTLETTISSPSFSKATNERKPKTVLHLRRSSSSSCNSSSSEGESDLLSSRKFGLKKHDTDTSNYSKKLSFNRSYQHGNDGFGIQSKSKVGSSREQRQQYSKENNNHLLNNSVQRKSSFSLSSSSSSEDELEKSILMTKSKQIPTNITKPNITTNHQKMKNENLINHLDSSSSSDSSDNNRHLFSFSKRSTLDNNNRKRINSLSSVSSLDSLVFPTKRREQQQPQPLLGQKKKEVSTKNNLDGRRRDIMTNTTQNYKGGYDNNSHDTDVGGADSDDTVVEKGQGSSQVCPIDICSSGDIDIGGDGV
jgi:hypothetical protein